MELRAGELCQFAVDTPSSFLDPTLAVRSAAGALLALNDDRGLGTGPKDSLLTFRPATSGTFYLDVGSYNGRMGPCTLTG